MLCVTFPSFGNSNNILVGFWASLSSLFPGRTSEVNNQNTPRNQGIVLGELNKVFFHWIIFIQFKMCSVDDQMMNFYFGFPPLVSKLPWSHLACHMPQLHPTSSAVAILSDFLFHPSVSFKMVLACLKWEKWERIAA